MAHSSKLNGRVGSVLRDGTPEDGDCPRVFASRQRRFQGERARIRGVLRNSGAAGGGEGSAGSSETAASFNVVASVLGGGVRGQADAVKLGIARALMQFNAELRKKLKSEGMISRDSRGKERKKYGQKGARKRFQFSKR